MTVCGEKIGRFEATLSPWLARASNSSFQLPRRSDFRISPITSWALAAPANAAAASAPALERKKRRLALIVIQGTLSRRWFGMQAIFRRDSKAATVNNVPTMQIETGPSAECAIAAKVPDAAETGMSQHQGFSSDYGGSMACETHEGVTAAKKERPLLFGNGRRPEFPDARSTVDRPRLLFLTPAADDCRRSAYIR